MNRIDQETPAEALVINGQDWTLRVTTLLMLLKVDDEPVESHPWTIDADERTILVAATADPLETARRTADAVLAILEREAA